MYFSRPNDSRMLVALGESYEKLSQQVEAKKVCSNCQWVMVCVINSLRFLTCFWFDIFCFCLVLLEGVLCWRCGENGSSQAGKVSVCQCRMRKYNSKSKMKQMMWSKNKVVSSHFLQHQAQTKDLVCSFMVVSDCISECYLYQTEKGAEFKLFYLCQAPRAAEWVRWCCPVLHAIHPRHFLLWGKRFQISFGMSTKCMCSFGICS